MFAQLVHFYTKQTCRCQAGLCCAGLGGVITRHLTLARYSWSLDTIPKLPRHLAALQRQCSGTINR